MMNKYFFFVVLLVAGMCFSANALEGSINITKIDTSICKVYILKIVTGKNAYIIYASNLADGSQFAIVSLKCRSRIGEKIRMGSIYELRLNPCYEYEIFPNHAYVFEVFVSGIKIRVPSKGWASNVVFSPDLLGLKIVRYCCDP